MEKNRQLVNLFPFLGKNWRGIRKVILHSNSGSASTLKTASNERQMQIITLIDTTE